MIERQMDNRERPPPLPPRELDGRPRSSAALAEWMAEARSLARLAEAGLEGDKADAARERADHLAVLIDTEIGVLAGLTDAHPSQRERISRLTFLLQRLQVDAALAAKALTRAGLGAS